jgi:predicted nucleotidyltransferase
VNNIIKIKDFISEGRVNSFYSDELNPDIWTREDIKGESKWVLDEPIRKKLLEIGEDFFNKFKEIFDEREYDDIILTGSLANYNYTEFSDFDVHVIMNLKGIDDEHPEILNEAIQGIRFRWNIRHDIKIKGYDVELFLQSLDDPDASTATYSLSKNSWIKIPSYKVPYVDEIELERKYLAYVYEIDQLETRLLHSSEIPSNSKELYKRAKSIKDKIQNMRGESLKAKGEFSIGNLTFKKLRNTGYIEKLIEIITKSYDKIFAE